MRPLGGAVAQHTRRPALHNAKRIVAPTGPGVRHAVPFDDAGRAATTSSRRPTAADRRENPLVIDPLIDGHDWRASARDADMGRRFRNLVAYSKYECDLLGGIPRSRIARVLIGTFRRSIPPTTTPNGVRDAYRFCLCAR